MNKMSCFTPCYEEHPLTIRGIYTSDLLSDVLVHARAHDTLITVQNHITTVAVASHKKLDAIIICHNKEIPGDMKEAAKEHHIALYTTALSQAEATLKAKELMV